MVMGWLVRMSEIDGVFVDNTAFAGNRRCWAECSLPYAGIHTDLAATETRWLGNDPVRCLQCKQAELLLANTKYVRCRFRRKEGSSPEYDTVA